MFFFPFFFAEFSPVKIQSKQAAGGFYAGHQHTAPLLRPASGLGFFFGGGVAFLSSPRQNIINKK